MVMVLVVMLVFVCLVADGDVDNDSDVFCCCGCEFCCDAIDQCGSCNHYPSNSRYVKLWDAMNNVIAAIDLAPTNATVWVKVGGVCENAPLVIGHLPVDTTC